MHRTIRLALLVPLLSSHAWAQGSCWQDLGSGLGGSQGEPVLSTTGTCVPSSGSFTLELENALPLAPGFLVVGFGELDLPLFGGTLVPTPDILLAMATDSAGEFQLALPWPFATAGTSLVFQSWLIDGSGPQGLTASNAVQGTGQYGGPMFAGAKYEPTGNSALSASLGDFDEDGVLDLVVVSGGSGLYQGEVSVLFGRGDGIMEPAENVHSGSSPSAARVGDLDLDGHQDIVIAHSLGVTVLLGSGDGSFDLPQSFSVTGDQAIMQLGDLNGDSFPDVIVGDSAGLYGLTPLLGTGAGALVPQPAIALPGGTLAFSIGDLNQDGAVDIVGVNSTGVVVLLGLGAGSFGAAQEIPLDCCPESVALGDLDQDGVLDVIVASGYQGLEILLGAGDGTLAAPQNLATPHYAQFVATADLDLDGNLELVACNQFLDEVYVFRGQGSATFDLPLTYTSGDFPVALGVGDMNLDGSMDLVVTNLGSEDVSIVMGVGDGSFIAPEHYDVSKSIGSVLIDDLNLDGSPDVVVAAGWYQLFVGSGKVNVLMGAGDGTLGAPQLVNGSGEGPNRLATGDFDLDGVPDLAYTTILGMGVSILLGTGDGSFTYSGTYPVGENPRGIAVGDLDQDGLPDLAVVNVPGLGADGVVLLLGHGDGTFGAGGFLAAGDASVSVAIGDLNADSALDLAVANALSHDVSLFLGTGSGAFSQPQSLSVAGGAIDLAIAKLNGDDFLDLAVVGGEAAGGAVSVFPGAGDGSFGSPTSFPVGPSPTDIAVGDLNRDGRPDLAVSSQEHDEVIVLLNSSGAGFAVQSFGAGDRMSSIAIGDLDLDGFAELVGTTNSAGSKGRVVVWRNLSQP